MGTPRGPARGAAQTAIVRVIGVLALACLLALDAPGVRASETPPALPTGTPQVVPAFRRADNVAVITIEGMINGVTANSFKRRLNVALEAGADAIVVDLNTPGGEVTSVLEVCKAIKGCGKHSIAWINPDAYSGGAIIALACREIVVAPGATMGDAAPISGDPFGLGMIKGMARTERAKALSPILVEIVDNARMNGYDENLVVAFVSLGAELWMVEDTQTGKRFFLTEHEYRGLFKHAPERGRPVVPSAGEAPRPDPVGTDAEEAAEDGALNPPADPRMAFKPPTKDISNRLVNELNSEISGLTQASSRPDFAHADASRYRDLGRATDGTTLLTIKEQTIKDFGLGVRTIANDDELKAFTGATHLRRLDQTWGENFASYLDPSGIVGLAYRGILIVVFLLCLFLELAMPGATVPGLVAVGALAGLLLPSLLVGAAAWWALGAIGTGVLLLLLEVFVLPGFGVAGISGLLLLLAGLVGTFADAGELFPGSGKGGGDLSYAVSVVLLAVFGAGIGMYMFSRYTRSFPVAGRLILGTSRPADDGEGLLAAMAPLPPAPTGLRIGEMGRATTPLRPSGTAEFDGKLVDVVAEFGFVEAGCPVRVVSTDFRIGVEAVNEVPGKEANA